MSGPTVRLHKHVEDNHRVVYTDGRAYDCPSERECWVDFPAAEAALLLSVRTVCRECGDPLDARASRGDNICAECYWDNVYRVGDE